MKLSKEDGKVKEQSKQMYKYRDRLKKELKKQDLQCLLEYNDQSVPVGEDKVCIPFYYFDLVERLSHLCVRLLFTKSQVLKIFKFRNKNDIIIQLAS
jgi:hypothetical protein